MLSSLIRLLTQRSWQHVSERDMYLASVEDSTMVFCVHERPNLSLHKPLNHH